MICIEVKYLCNNGCKIMPWDWIEPMINKFYISENRYKKIAN